MFTLITPLSYNVRPPELNYQPPTMIKHSLQSLVFLVKLRDVGLLSFVGSSSSIAERGKLQLLRPPVWRGEKLKLLRPLQYCRARKRNCNYCEPWHKERLRALLCCCTIAVLLYYRNNVLLYNCNAVTLAVLRRPTPFNSQSPLPGPKINRVGGGGGLLK